jgi:hypothetical protein
MAMFPLGIIPMGALVIGATWPGTGNGATGLVAMGFDATNAEGTGTKAELYVTPLPTTILVGGALTCADATALAGWAEYA